MLFCEVILGTSDLEEASGQTQNTLERLHIPCGLEAPQDPLEELEYVSRERDVWATLLVGLLPSSSLQAEQNGRIAFFFTYTIFPLFIEGTLKEHIS